MSKLISMRQRIKAIETIKKVTHTMQLISMSTHTKLKKRQIHLIKYVESIKQVYRQVQNKYPNNTHSNINNSQTRQTPTQAAAQSHSPAQARIEEKNLPEKILLIVIGSQKGLCGNFNSMIFNNINNDPYLAANHEKITCIAVGQKAINEIKTKTTLTPLLTYGQLTHNTISTITGQIIEYINSTLPAYTNILVWSNRPKTFFIQKPHATFLLSPELTTEITHTPETSSTGQALALSNEDYITEYPAHEIIELLKKQLGAAQLEMLLFESLLAEQAARFISMDSATRNAKNMLDDLTLQFNKIRQAKITKELTELVGSF